MRFPHLRRVERGDKIPVACASHGYRRANTPVGGVLYETHEESIFISDAQLREAGYVPIERKRVPRTPNEEGEI